MTQSIAGLAAEHGRVAVDTEFMSERRYRALLCLVQVAVPDPEGDDGVRTDVLDPLEGGFDPAPLAEALADPSIEVVMHAGRQDIALLRRDWKTEVHGLFDTQVAAAFLGLGPQEGYESLVRRVLGIKLKGGEGFTRWDRRPLTDDQLSYARADASRLLALGEELQQRLEERERLEWALEECRPSSSRATSATLSGCSSGCPRSGASAPRAAAWPASWWTGASRRPSGRTAPPLDPARPGADRAGPPYAPLARRPWRRSAASPADPAPPPPRAARGHRARPRARRPRRGGAPPRDSRDAPVVALAQAVVRHRAQEAEVATELVATQAELAELVSALRTGEAPKGPCGGRWRHELVGRELEELLAGRRSVSVAGGARLELDETYGRFGVGLSAAVRGACAPAARPRSSRCRRTCRTPRRPPPPSRRNRDTRPHRRAAARPRARP